MCRLVLHVEFLLQDAHVIEMTQELAKMLGLKIRKPYVRSKVKCGKTTFRGNYYNNHPTRLH